MPVNGRCPLFNVRGVVRGAHNWACGNSVCHPASRQTCLGVAATRYLTGPNATIWLSVSKDTGTGELTHNEPSESFTIAMRVVKTTPKSRTFGPSTIHRWLPNARSSNIVHTHGESRACRPLQDSDCPYTCGCSQRTNAGDALGRGDVAPSASMRPTGTPARLGSKLSMPGGEWTVSIVIARRHVYGATRIRAFSSRRATLAAVMAVQRSSSNSSRA